MGLTLMIPRISAILESHIGKLTSMFYHGNQKRATGFWSGFISGVSLGIVWTPCAGPILATIITLAATRSLNLGIISVTVIYMIGIGIPLFLFAFYGNRLVAGSRFLTKYTGRIQQTFGLVMIVTAIFIFTNYDKILETKLLDIFPSYSQILTRIESNSMVLSELSRLKGMQPVGFDSGTNDLFNVSMPAPDFTGITKWLNTDNALTLMDLKGKVVLVDFWTYTCINCLRTLPHLTAWYDKYHNEGFTVIGVHTPEFEFEKNSDNVLAAIKQYNIRYPVAQDNSYETWNRFNNQYWPAEYLIDANGTIRRTHFGEGDYDKTELAIQTLLKESGKLTSSSLSTIPDETPNTPLSPETYLGSNRMEYYFPSGNIGNGVHNFNLSDQLPQHSFSFGGEWNIMSEYAVSGKDATLEYNFLADKVFLVLRPERAGAIASMRIYIDGKIADETNAGSDVKDGMVTIDNDRLYNLINFKGTGGNHKLRLEFENPGTMVFAFTFG